MEQTIFVCPCCGHRFQVTVTVDGIAVAADAARAAEFGIEFGALEGGEKIGD